ncbi:MAG: hypothetical protein Q8865_03655 [Bacillota bacterium]|nr:hypothetical protein [Bacillota bacterium]
MKNKKWLYLLSAVVGAALLCLGKFVFSDESVKMISGLCYGVGAAVFALGIGKFIDAFIVSKTEKEEFTRKKNIEVNDERNIRIRERVGSKINHVMIYAITAVMLTMAYMDMGITAILLVASLFLIELVLCIVLFDYYSKRM